MSKFTIKVYQNGKVVNTYFPETIDEARELYYKFEANIQQYTQLIVGKKEYPTALAKQYLGISPIHHLGL